jgi:L-iditol 2-dehydrogenase
MLALVKFGKGWDGVELREVPVPFPKEDEIKVEIHAAGICGTDIHIIHDVYETIWPVTMGHEFSGTVVEVGANVRDFKPGDKIISISAIESCGTCQYCSAGNNAFCHMKKSIGSKKNGAFAKYMVVPAAKAFHIPEGVSMDVAVIAEPLACAVRSVVEHTIIKAGDYVMITGPGSIGNFAMQLAKMNGGFVIMVGLEKDKERLALAAQMGAYATLYADDHIESKIAELTEGRGVDVAIECSGSASGAKLCLESLKCLGRYTQTGLYGKEVQMDMDIFIYKGIQMWSGYSAERSSWERMIRLLKNHSIDVEPLLTNKLPLTEWRKGIALMENGEAYKVLLNP